MSSHPCYKLPVEDRIKGKNIQHGGLDNPIPNNQQTQFCIDKHGYEWNVSGTGKYPINQDQTKFKYWIGCNQICHLGEKKTCCTTGESGIDQITCHPKYIENTNEICDKPESNTKYMFYIVIIFSILLVIYIAITYYREEYITQNELSM